MTKATRLDRVQKKALEIDKVRHQLANLERELDSLIGSPSHDRVRGAKPKGLAALSPERRSEIAALGGAARGAARRLKRKTIP